MRCSDFFFNCVLLLYYKCPGWIKNIKATINRVNKKGKRCFHYAVAIELEHEEV